MDGASILTFITTGLQAIQTIHGILSSISDGPARLSDLRDALCDLQQLLEQIRDDPTLSSAIDKRGEAMEKSVLRCNNYIQCLQKKVVKLSLSPGDGLHEKFKKRLKLTLSEKEILYMLDSISRHMASLTLQSNIRHTSSLAEINNRNQRIQLAVDGLASKVSEMPSLSSLQDMGILTTLNELRSSYTTLASRILSAAEHVSIQSTRRASDETQSLKHNQDNEILRAFEVFGKFIDKEEQTLSAEETEDIVDTLEVIVKWISKISCDNEEAHNFIQDVTKRDYTREIKKLAAQFVSAPSVRLNDQRKSQIPFRYKWNMWSLTPSLGLQGLFRSPPRSGSRTYCNVDINFGTTVLACSTELRRCNKGKSAESPEPDTTEFMSTVTFMCSDVYPQIFIKALIQYQSRASGVLSATPCISVNRVVSNDSEIFHNIRNGDINSLRRLLQEGKASIRDRDEHGASLLHYATRSHCQEIVGFLIQHGADVNDLSDARNTIYPTNCRLNVSYVVYVMMASTPLHLVGCTEQDLIGNRVEFDRQLRTFKLLLAAGADSPSYSRLLWSYPTEFLAAVLDPDTSVVDVDNIPELDVAARRSYTQSGAEKISFVRISDSSVNPLHFLLCNLRIAAGLWRHDFDNIKSLISAGADINTTYNGMTCSELAYSLASWTGDMWDAILVSFGYDIRDFRKGHPRKVYYTSLYTRRIFEEIWSGVEYSCPYYDPCYDHQIYDAVG